MGIAWSGITPTSLQRCCWQDEFYGLPQGGLKSFRASRRKAGALFLLEQYMQHDNTRLGGEQLPSRVTLNSEQKLYVIATDSGYSCFGFDNARDHTNQIAQRMDRTDLSFTTNDYATLAGYRKYEEAVSAWSRSALSKRTYFAPGTDPKAAAVLEYRRQAGGKVRLVLGNTLTGEPWLNEYDVVGRIGRSSGGLKVPLLLEDGASGGGAILTACVLSIVDWKSGRTLYRHPAYMEPDLGLQPSDNPEHPWAVLHLNGVIARFKDIGKACAYIAFMRGETIEPRIFQ